MLACLGMISAPPRTGLLIYYKVIDAVILYRTDAASFFPYTPTTLKSSF